MIIKRCGTLTLNLGTTFRANDDENTVLRERLAHICLFEIFI